MQRPEILYQLTAAGIERSLKAGHGSLPSSDWQVRILRPIVEAPARFLEIGGVDLLQDCAV
jgi:hypothetical protein